MKKSNPNSKDLKLKTTTFISLSKKQYIDKLNVKTKESGNVLSKSSIKFPGRRKTDINLGAFKNGDFSSFKRLTNINFTQKDNLAFTDNDESVSSIFQKDEKSTKIRVIGRFRPLNQLEEVYYYLNSN